MMVYFLGVSAMKNSLCFAIVGFVVFACLSVSADAAPITVPNAGFEDRALLDDDAGTPGIQPMPDGYDRYVQWAKEYWRHFEVDNNGGPVRIWNPGAPGVPWQGTCDVGFEGNAPEGDYVAVVRARYNNDEMPEIRPIRDWEAAVQILEATFDPTMTYTLTVKVGRLPAGVAEGGSINYTPAWYGYALQIAVGGENVGGSMYAGRVEGGTVIAEDSNSLTVPVNGFVTATVTYIPNPADVGLAGLPLQIRLCALENPADHSLMGWAAFDDVTLDAEMDPTFPTVDAGEDMLTWSGEPVELDPNVVNNDPCEPQAPLTYLWTADDPCAVFDPSADVEDPNVTIIKPALTLTTVSIVNPGFESPVLADGDYTLNFTNCPGWSNVDVSTAGGVWNPGLPGTAFPGYEGNAPEGQNIAYVNSSGIKQVLTKMFAVETTYTLTVKVGNTDGFPWTGYKVQLLAGETVLAEDDNTVAIATGTFGTSTVTYTYDSGDSALLGQALQIRLLCLGEGGEADFDDVQLTAEAPTPVPYVVTLTLAVNNEGSATEVKDTMKVYVYDDACQAARMGKGLGTDNPGDFNGDCITDAKDLDELAAKWLTGDALTVPIPKP
jgi:hypothetical protein